MRLQFTLEVRALLTTLHLRRSCARDLALCSFSPLCVLRLAGGIGYSHVYCADLILDPATVETPGWFYSSNNLNVTNPNQQDYYQVTFPPAPGWPYGFPTPISTVYYGKTGGA